MSTVAAHDFPRPGCADGVGRLLAAVSDSEQFQAAIVTSDGDLREIQREAELALSTGETS